MFNFLRPRRTFADRLRRMQPLGLVSTHTHVRRAYRRRRRRLPSHDNVRPWWQSRGNGREIARFPVGVYVIIIIHSGLGSAASCKAGGGGPSGIDWSPSPGEPESILSPSSPTPAAARPLATAVPLLFRRPHPPPPPDDRRPGLPALRSLSRPTLNYPPARFRRAHAHTSARVHAGYK